MFPTPPFPSPLPLSVAALLSPPQTNGIEAHPATAVASTLEDIRRLLETRPKDELVQLCVDMIAHVATTANSGPYAPDSASTPFSFVSPPISAFVLSSPPERLAPLPPPQLPPPGDVPSCAPAGGAGGASLRERFMNGNDVLSLPRVDPLMPEIQLTSTLPTAMLSPGGNEASPHLLHRNLTTGGGQGSLGRSMKRVVSTANVTLQSACWSDDEDAGLPKSHSSGSPYAPGSSGMLAESSIETPSRNSLRRHVLPPELINDKFEVYGRLSAGRTADVFHALDLEFGIPCVIKAIPRKHVRYLDTGVPREAEALLRVEHPHISKLRTCIDDPSHDNVYLILDLVDGCLPIVSVDANLGTAISNVPHEVLPLVVAQVCDALRHMHSKHVVHGDLKPDNVVVSRLKSESDDGEPASRALHVTILDLGAAVFCERRMGLLIGQDSVHLPFDQVAARDDGTEAHLGLTPAPFSSPAVQTTESEADGPPSLIPVCLRKGVMTTGMTCVEPRRRHATRVALREAVRRGTQTSQGGAALFCAPELFEGAMPTRASDVWALGVLLFAALFGTLPFFGKTTGEVKDAVMAGQPKFPAASDISPEQRLWRPILRGMLEQDPFDRMKLSEVYEAAIAFSNKHA